MLFDLKHRRVDEISMEKQFTSSEPFFFCILFSPGRRATITNISFFICSSKVFRKAIKDFREST